jgi:hypothetical protein
VSAVAGQLVDLTATRGYVVAGIRCAVTADSRTLELVEDTYGAFRSDEAGRGSYEVRVDRDPEGLVVSDSEGRSLSCTDETGAALAVIEAVVRHVTGLLAVRGVYAVHAASLVHNGRSLILCGRSMSGKTTLALALLARGFGLLSDEFALSAPDARTILPYRRGVHVRPGTPELVPELAFLNSRDQHPLSGGFQWTVGFDELECIFPGRFPGPAPLGHVVFLERRTDRAESSLEPVPKGVAAVDLVRSTTATPSHFEGVMGRMASLAEHVPCLRLIPGRLESSVELLSRLVAEDR